MPKSEKGKKKKKFRCSEPTCKATHTPQKRSHPLKRKDAKYAKLVYCNKCYCQKFRYGSASKNYSQWVASLPKSEKDLWLNVRPLPTSASSSASGQASSASSASVSASVQASSANGSVEKAKKTGIGGGGSENVISSSLLRAAYDSSEEGSEEEEEELLEYYISKEAEMPVQDFDPDIPLCGCAPPDNQNELERDGECVHAATLDKDLLREGLYLADLSEPSAIPDEIQERTSPFDEEECINCIDLEEEEEEREKDDEVGDDEVLDLIDVD